MTLRAGFVVVSMFAVFGCASDVGTSAGPVPTNLPTAGWRPTAIEFLGNPPEVSAPAGIHVNDTARVSFTIYRTGCVREIKNETSVAGLEAEVHTYQLEYVPDPSETCAKLVAVEGSSARLSFSQPGQARIRLFGRQYPGDGPVMVERFITVLP